MQDINVRIGKAIHTYRKAQGMTLDDLAAKIFKSKSTFGKYEQGLIACDISVLMDISQALNVPPQLIQMLRISPEDYRNTRKLNQFTLEPMF